MLTDHLQELAAAKAKVAELESTIVAERRQTLVNLPAQLGYATVQDLIAALKEANGVTKKAKPARKAAAKTGAKTGTRSRTRITDEIRAKVKALVEAGQSGAEIAAATGISLPSVQNIKRDLGLVKPRKA